MDLKTIDCFAYTQRGCMALSYTVEELTPNICANCKFKKTKLQCQLDKFKKKHSNIAGFYLYMDGKKQGFFTSIIEADKWLKKYFIKNIDNEYIPANAIFDDYNVLFVNHSIIFKLQEGENE